MSTVTVFNVANERVTKDFGEIYREHYLLVYRTARSVTGRPQDAEDVLQNVFLWLLRNGMPAGITDPKSYLYRAAVNASLNVVRSRKRERLDDDVEVASVSPEAEASLSNDAADVRQCLSDAMTQLNPSAVEMLVLRYEHNYSDAEIARLLGKSRGVVAVTLHRARARLKKLLRTSSPGEKK
jgi:RNA polymerase sigma-70 factor, ECF subfamily